MADWRDAEKAADDWREAEGGAMGGGGSDAQQQGRLIKPEPLEDPAVVEARKAREDKELRESTMNALTHGQWLDDLGKRDPKAARKYERKTEAGLAASALSGLSGAPLVGSHLDELFGAASSKSLSGPDYERERDKARATIAAAQSHDPAAEVIGSFVTPLPKTAKGRIAYGTLAGASAGVGEAPDLKSAPKAGVVGGLTGAGTSLLAEGLISGGDKIGAKGQAIEDKVRAAKELEAAKAYRSGVGGLGGEANATLRGQEVMKKGLEDLHTPAELREMLAKAYNSPEAVADRLRSYKNALEAHPDRMAQMIAAEEKMAAAKAGRAPEAIEAATQARLNDPTALKRRLGELLPKIVLPAVGGALGGPLGAGAGGLAGAVLGRSATTARNLIADPYVATRLLGAAGSTLGGAGRAVSASSPMMSRAVTDKYLDATQGPQSWSKFIEQEDEGDE